MKFYKLLLVLLNLVGWLRIFSILIAAVTMETGWPHWYEPVLAEVFYGGLMWSLLLDSTLTAGLVIFGTYREFLELLIRVLQKEI